MYFNSGYVGIGNNNPEYTLDVFGSLRVTGTIYSSNYATISDYRVKENPIELDETFSIDKLRPVKYINRISNKEDYGFIAHEVQNIYPCLVQGEKDGSDLQNLNYLGIIPLLVNEIKQMKIQIEKLQKK
jgi:hypothetical protein